MVASVVRPRGQRGGMAVEGVGERVRDGGFVRVRTGSVTIATSASAANALPHRREQQRRRTRPRATWECPRAAS
jgi:hypothetical protein